MVLGIEKNPTLRWTLFTVLLLIMPALFAFAEITANRSLLVLSIMPAVIGLLWMGPVSGSTLAVLSMFISLLGGIRETESALRPLILFNIPVLLITATLAFVYRHRSQEENNLHEERGAVLAEQLTLIREQYKNDLMINITNQKKFKKYSLLNRISRNLGAHLQLDKLADAVIHNMREVIGPERGSYFLSFQSASQEAVTRSLPVSRTIESVQDDQYGIWVNQHRTALLVADTNGDFRFQTLGTDSLVRSLMMAPLLADGQIIGFLRAESPWTNMFSTDDLRLFSIIADMTAAVAENARLYHRAEELAITDGLTGLYLRRFFTQRFEEELVRFREHAIPFSLLILDIDHFKRINDRLGHLAGDQILEQLAKCLQAEVRVADILCRFGGEEFAILLPNTQLEGALVMAERTRNRVAEKAFMALNDQLNLTISIGVGECPRHADAMSSLIRCTDEALYMAKRNGRNQVVPVAESAKENRT